MLTRRDRTRASESIKDIGNRIFREFAARRLHGQMDNVREMLEWYPDLSPWRPITDRSVALMRVCDSVRAQLAGRAVLSKKMLQELLPEIDGRILSDAPGLLTKYDVVEVKRTESQTTYQLAK